MNITDIGNDEFSFEYKGYTSRYTIEAYNDILEHQGIDLVKYMTKMIDKFSLISEPQNFCVKCSYIINEHNMISTTIEILPYTNS